MTAGKARKRLKEDGKQHKNQKVEDIIFKRAAFPARACEIFNYPENKVGKIAFL